MKQKKGATKNNSPYRFFTFKPSREKDAELIKHVELQDNINDYLKKLIIKDMQKKK